MQGGLESGICNRYKRIGRIYKAIKLRQDKCIDDKGVHSANLEPRRQLVG